LQQRFVQEPDLDAVADELRKILGVLRHHVVLRGLFAERLVAQRVEEQARRDEAVRGIALDQRARGQHDALAHLVHRDAVVEVLQRRLEDTLRADAGEALAGFLDEGGEALEVEWLRHAVVDDDDLDCLGFAALLRFLVRALLRAPLAVKHVGARDFVLAATHEHELDLVLDFLDVDRAAFRLALHQRGDDGVGELHDLVAHARARRTVAAVDGEKRLGHGDGDLGRLEADDRAIAADHLVLGVAGSAAGMALPGSPARTSRGGWFVAAVEALVSCMGCSPVENLSL